jgi:hypothetical protein
VLFRSNNGATSRGSSSIIESIKARSTIQSRIDDDGVIHDPTQGAPVGKIRATVESSKMREILNKQFGDED